MTQMTDVAHLEQQVIVNAPVQNVFDVLANLDNFPRYADAGRMKDVAKVDDAIVITYSPKLPGLNLSLPISFRFRVSLADVQEPTAVTMDMDGLAKGTIYWTLEDQGNATLLKVSMDYQLSVDVIRNAFGGSGEKGGLRNAIGNVAGGIANGVAQAVSSLLTTNSSNLRKTLVSIKEMAEGRQEELSK